VINEEIRCLHFPGDTSSNVFFEENEIIIDDAQCKVLKTKLDTTQQPEKTVSERADQPIRNPEISLSDFSSTSTEIPEIQITINVPRGQVSQIMGLMSFLQQK
jgi:hypothetical protein